MYNYDVLFGEDIMNECKRMVTQRTATMKQFFFYNGVNFLHVNGHTAVRPGMACVPLGNHW